MTSKFSDGVTVLVVNPDVVDARSTGQASLLGGSRESVSFLARAQNATLQNWPTANRLRELQANANAESATRR